MLGSKFVKFLTSILKWQVNFSSNFASFFIAMRHNSSVKFKLILFLLWIKESDQSPILSLSSALVKICHIPHAIFKPQVSFSSNFASSFSFMKDNSSVLFRSTLNSLHNRNKWRWTFWRLISARVKFKQILVIFETTDQFFFKFYINLQGHDTTFLYFLAKSLYSLRSLSKYKFGKILREQSKVWNFALLWAPFVQIMYSFS